MKLLELIQPIVKDYLPLTISIFTLFLVIKNENRANPNLTFRSGTIWSGFKSSPSVHEWAIENGITWNETFGAGVTSITYTLQNVGNLPVNWGFVYFLDFENRQIACSKPIFYIDTKEIYTIKFSTLTGKKTERTVIDNLFWKLAELYFNVRGLLEKRVSKFVSIVVFSDFNNSKYMLIKSPHTLKRFTKTQTNLNLFHPIICMIFKYIQKETIFQKNTFEDRHEVYIKTPEKISKDDLDKYFDVTFREES